MRIYDLFLLVMFLSLLFMALMHYIPFQTWLIVAIVFMVLMGVFRFIKNT